jgi:hypothetical protein
MPYVVDSGEWRRDASIFERENFNYNYPLGLNLKPGSDLHDDIVRRILQYSRKSAMVISERHPIWHDMDDKLTGYIPLTKEEEKIKREDVRKPISIVFPYTYAILETLMSYMMSAFVIEPMFRYEGVGPEDVTGAFLLEKLINLQVIRSKVALNLHTLFRDSNAYGVGVVSPQWEVKRGKRIVRRPTGYADATGTTYTTGEETGVEDTVLFEGNTLINVDPYRYLPDSTVPIHDVQRGEFVGWVSTTNFYDKLLQEKADAEGYSFNVKYLKSIPYKYTTIFRNTPAFESGSRSGGFHRRHGDSLLDRNMANNVDDIHMYVKLIPKEWKIGKSEDPEKWLFTISNDHILTQIKPLGLLHDMFPVCVAAPDFDGYSPVSFSRLEILSGMQTVIDWMFNSHIANVRKAINDMLIVDPFLLNMKDLENPEPGKLVRLRRPAWGRGQARDAVHQLVVNDITARNLQDVNFVIQYMQQIMGVDAASMGSLRTSGPERLTSSEFRGTAQAATSRLERVAKVTGIQCLQDIGYMFAFNCQQLIGEETWLRSVGDWPKTIMEELGPNVQNGRVKVEPKDLYISYDVIPRDGSIPGGNFNESWLKLYEMVLADPQLRQQVDILRLYEYIAVNLGMKNAQDFRAKPTGQVNVGTAPDEQIQQQVQAGNMIPMNGALSTNGASFGG